MIRKYFFESMVGPTIIVTVFMITGLLNLVPYLAEKKSQKDLYQESERIVSYIKIFRSYYSKNILSKVTNSTNLYASYDHKTNKDAIPLPATMVHDLGELFTKRSNSKVQMYSSYPFPNRKSRVLDDFQKEALAYVMAHPQENYSRKDVIDGKLYYRTAIPDYMTAQTCIECHNHNEDTPKSNWKMGDVRGVIEVSIPFPSHFSSDREMSYTIVLFIIFNFGLLGLYYYLFMKAKNRKLHNLHIKKDKLLSEYKKAVDMGAIVSKADSKGFITYVNDTFIKISGYTEKELIGAPHSLVRHPESDPEVFKEMWKTIKAKKIWQGNIKNRAKDGTIYYVYASIVPILDENNEIVEYLAIRYDTTELHRAIKKANDAEEAKGRFLANMSHELRTPLNAIIGFSQILQRRGTLSTKDALYVEKIGVSGQNLLALVNSILDFSKIEAGKMEFYVGEISIKSLFDEVNIMFETAVEEKGIKYKMFEIDKELTIIGDKQHLKQAFTNIISNAIKFTPVGGEIKLSYEYKDKTHHFSICDTGDGISEDEMKTLFTPFIQGESAHKNAAKGTGLGLAITKKIITQLHNGNIWVESELGKGTCFYISLENSKF
jgi:PAS domain S-box-containing protein